MKPSLFIRKKKKNCETLPLLRQLSQDYQEDTNNKFIYEARDLAQHEQYFVRRLSLTQINKQHSNSE